MYVERNRKSDDLKNYLFYAGFRIVTMGFIVNYRLGRTKYSKKLYLLLPGIEKKAKDGPT